MRVPGRRWSGNLVLMSATPPETNIDHIAPSSPFIATFPKAVGLYPLREFNELTLYWGQWSIGASTFVDLTMIAFRGFLIPPSSASFNVGNLATGQNRFEIYQQVFEQLDTTNGRENPFQARIRKTAADPTAMLNTQTYSIGTRHSFPITDDYIGFLIQSDNASIGQITLYATLGSTGSSDQAG